MAPSCLLAVWHTTTFQRAGDTPFAKVRVTGSNPVVRSGTVVRSISAALFPGSLNKSCLCPWAVHGLSMTRVASGHAWIASPARPGQLAAPRVPRGSTPKPAGSGGRARRCTAPVATPPLVSPSWSRWPAMPGLRAGTVGDLLERVVRGGRRRGGLPRRCVRPARSSTAISFRTSGICRSAKVTTVDVDDSTATSSEPVTAARGRPLAAGTVHRVHVVLHRGLAPGGALGVAVAEPGEHCQPAAGATAGGSSSRSRSRCCPARRRPGAQLHALRLSVSGGVDRRETQPGAGFGRMRGSRLGAAWVVQTWPFLVGPACVPGYRAL